MRKVALALLLAAALAGAGAAASGWTTYRDKLHGFRFKHPVGRMLWWEPGELRIDLPFSPGTTLVEKYLLVEVVNLCPAGKAVWIAGKRFSLATGEEGAAGSLYRYWRYSLPLPGGECLILTFVIRVVDPFVFDRPPPSFSQPEETAVFTSILATLEIDFPPGPARGGAGIR